MAFYGGPGVSLNNGGQGTNAYSLQAGETATIPAGFWNLQHGGYSQIQFLDPYLGIYVPCGMSAASDAFIHSDGVNYRIANQTGCVVAALLTNGGSAYTSAPTVTVSAGGSKAVAIMGQAVSSITVNAGGSNYVYPPQVVIAFPPSPGIPATAYATLSSGAVSTITVDNQGGGYASVPFVALINDPRDTTGNGALATAVLGTANTVTGVLITDHGNPMTTLPTISFTGGGGSGAAATALMCWTVTGITVGNAGAGYATPVRIQTLNNGIPTTAPAYTNPQTQGSFIRTRDAVLQGAVSAGGITTASIVLDGGIIGGTASNIGVNVINGVGVAPTTAATLTLNVGGTSDFYRLMKA